MGKELTIDTFSENFCGLEALDRCQQLLGCQCSFALPCRSSASHHGERLLRFRRETHLLPQHDGAGPLVDSPLIPCWRNVVFLKCGIFLARAIIFPCRGVHCLSVDVGLPMFRTVVAGAVAFPSTCLATDVTIYFLDWSCRRVPCSKFAAWVRSFPLFRGLHFFSRSTRYPAKECALWLRECFWIDVERNEDRVQPPSISNRLP